MVYFKFPLLLLINLIIFVENLLKLMEIIELYLRNKTFVSLKYYNKI